MEEGVGVKQLIDVLIEREGGYVNHPADKGGPTCEQTLAALDAFLERGGKDSGETVLLRALEALQGERYLRLAERRPANEAFLYGWLANRIGEK